MVRCPRRLRTLRRAMVNATGGMETWYGSSVHRWTKMQSGTEFFIRGCSPQIPYCIQLPQMSVLSRSDSLRSPKFTPPNTKSANWQKSTVKVITDKKQKKMKCRWREKWRSGGCLECLPVSALAIKLSIRWELQNTITATRQSIIHWVETQAAHHITGGRHASHEGNTARLISQDGEHMDGNGVQQLHVDGSQHVHGV